MLFSSATCSARHVWTKYSNSSYFSAGVVVGEGRGEFKIIIAERWAILFSRATVSFFVLNSKMHLRKVRPNQEPVIGSNVM